MSRSSGPEHTPEATMRLTCQRVTDLILDYVTDDMESTLRAALERHLHNCADCRAFLNTYRQTIRTTRVLHYDDIPEEMLSRVQRFLRERIECLPPDR